MAQKQVGVAPSGTTDVVTKGYVDARSVEFTIGNGTSTYVLTHNLGTTSVHVTIYEISTGAYFIPDTGTRTTTQITLGFGFLVSTNRFKVVVSV